MAEVPTTSLQSTVSMLKVADPQLLPQLLANLTSGDTLSLSVRSTTEEGIGTLVLNGQLLKAALPQEIQAGDKLIAQIAKNGDQLVLRLLDVIRPQVTSSFPAAYGTSRNSLQNGQQLETLLRTVLQGTEKNLSELSSEQISRLELPLNKEMAAVLAQIVPDTTDSGTIETALKQTLTDSSPNLIQQLAQSLRSMIDEGQSKSPERVITIFKNELSALFGKSEELLRNDPQFLKKIVQAFESEVSNETLAYKAAQKSPKELAKALVKATSLPATQQQELESKLETILAKVQSEIPGQMMTEPEKVLAGELKTLVTKLDQLSSAQETLNRLNPALQALAEPTLVLFPFLLQGFFAQAEVVVDPRQNQKQQQGKKTEGDGSNKKNRADSLPYDHFHLSVPLPSIGVVNADVAHRPGNMLIRFTVEDEEAAGFLSEQLEQLGAILRENGAGEIEFTTVVGEPKSLSGRWAGTDLGIIA